MLGQPVTVAVGLGCLVLGVAACGAKHPPPADLDETGGTAGAEPGEGGLAGSTSGGIAGAGNTTTGGSTTGGTGGTAGSTGTGGVVVVAECGNGDAELNEQCDGTDFGAHSCQSLGFDEGELVCNDCEIDYSGCSGTENCFDFRDNDGDRAIDCADSECADVCADPCANAPAIDDPAVISGTTVGRAAALEPSCNDNGALTGPEVVYQFTAAHTGIIDASVVSSANLTVSLRTACEDVSSELGCAFGVHVERAVTAGDTVFVIVDGLDSSTAGAFTLEVASRAVTCGDGYRDGDEACDDGNTDADDGCSATCEVELAESADNDSLGQADDYVEPFFGSVTPAGDEDWVEFTVASAPGALAIDTFDLGDGACALRQLDSALELYDADGVLVAEDDDGGAGYCARIVLADLPVGTYYVRVLASPAGATATFPYRLNIDVDSCGNGRQAEAEECDDGNRINWDGCNSNCKLE